VQILTGHVLDRLAELPDESVHCVVTSPPYYGLRDYGIEPQVWPEGWRGSLGLEPSKTEIATGKSAKAPSRKNRKGEE
jgi:DNA modification methylase